MKANKKLNEAIGVKNFMTKEEKNLKKKLIKLLVDNHHTKYAKRLNLFDVNIVPLSANPNFTASISFGEGLIYIGEGFLKREDEFFQLDVLLRHELAHNLLMHQVRLMHKLGDDLYKNHLMYSGTIHNLLNIIADFEISNTRYTEEDKNTIRNLKRNGQLIQGLVTEDFRDWTDLSVEEMLDKLKEEIDNLNNKLISSNMSINQYKKHNDTDMIVNDSLHTFKYSSAAGSLKNKSRIEGSLSDFINGKTVYVQKVVKALKLKVTLKFKDLAPWHQEIMKKINDICQSPDSYYYNDKEHTEEVLMEIANSSPTVPYTFTQKDKDGNVVPGEKVIIATPEEKYMAIECFKSLADWQPKKPTLHVRKATDKKSQEYINMYNKVIKTFGGQEFDIDDIAAILNATDAAIQASKGGNSQNG